MKKIEIQGILQDIKNIYDLQDGQNIQIINVLKNMQKIQSNLFQTESASQSLHINYVNKLKNLEQEIQIFFNHLMMLKSDNKSIIIKDYLTSILQELKQKNESFLEQVSELNINQKSKIIINDQKIKQIQILKAQENEDFNQQNEDFNQQNENLDFIVQDSKYCGIEQINKQNVEQLKHLQITNTQISNTQINEEAISNKTFGFQLSTHKNNNIHNQKPGQKKLLNQKEDEDSQQQLLRSNLEQELVDYGDQMKSIALNYQDKLNQDKNVVQQIENKLDQQLKNVKKSNNFVDALINDSDLSFCQLLILAIIATCLFLFTIFVVVIL